MSLNMEEVKTILNVDVLRDILSACGADAEVEVQEDGYIEVHYNGFSYLLGSEAE